MNPILIIFDVLALLFLVILLYSLNPYFKKLFVIGAFIPLVIIAIISFFVSKGAVFVPKEILLFMLRGGLLIAVISGTLTCFIASQLEKRKSKSNHG